MKSANFIFFFISICCSSLWATNQPVSSEFNKKPILENRENKKKKKISMDQSDLMPDSHTFGFIGTYMVAYDSLDNVEPKTHKHKLSLSTAYSFDEYWSSYGSISISHETHNMDIYRSNRVDPYHQMSNLNMGMVYKKKAPLKFVQISSSTFNISLPVSEHSRVDKHITNLSMIHFMNSYGWKGLSLSHRLVANYLWNTQKFSIFLNDQMNRDWVASNSFGLTYIFSQKIGARFNYHINMKRYLDESWDLSFGNNLSLFYNLNSFQFFLRMINNSYPENDRIDLGYYDKHRMVFTGGVTYAF